jgi:hypothetical protein
MTSPGKAPLPALAITHTTGQYAGGHPRDPICSQQRRVGDLQVAAREGDLQVMTLHDSWALA